MKTNLISKSETAQLLKIVSEKWKIEIPKVKNLKVHEIDNETQLITGNEIKILKIGDEHIPFLSEVQTLEKFPYVQVDMGAVKFMCKGANLMRPGIKKFSDWPTIPQLYVKEEFIGGCDIVKEMHETGELLELFNSRGIEVKPS